MKLTTNDPEFNPDKPVWVNGYKFLPDPVSRNQPDFKRAPESIDVV